MMRLGSSLLLRCSVGACALAIAGQAVALQNQQQQQRFQFDMPAQDLSTALRSYARLTGQQVAFRQNQLRGARAPALRGSYDAPSALDALLTGSNFAAQRGNTGVIVVRPAAVQARAATPPRTQPAQAIQVASRATDPDQEDVVITGSRIRGAPPAAPVIEITAEDARNAGQNDLGTVIRSLPQNFSGGRNPQIGGGAEGFGSEASSSASQPNLRGLGPGATVSLLNGRRLPYSVTTTAADISTIPLSAVDRIEVLVDGASALYGSDAIGGVVNVLTRRNYEGVTLRGRVGTATDGGFGQRQINGSGGVSWGSGSLLVSGDYSRSTAVVAGRRTYTFDLHPSYTLYPDLRSWSAFGSVSQDIGPSISLGIDALYYTRDTVSRFTRSATEPCNINGQCRTSSSETLYLSPSVDVRVAGSWRAQFNATYGDDQATAITPNYFGGNLLSNQYIEFRNRTRGIEASADGPLFNISSDPVRLAVGSGFRDYLFRRFQGTGPGSAGTTISPERDSYYAYGELFVPIISSSQGVGGVRRLAATGALRYEHNDAFGGVVTPKFGLSYQPVADITLSGTWGRSFRSPTLFDQFRAVNATLVRPATLGQTGLPTTATAITLSGGNPNLEPERSTNWTVTAALHPTSVPGLRLEATYFDIAYTDRIVAPITSQATALVNPIFAPFITRNPTLSQVDAAIAASTSGLTNSLGQVFNPALVVAISDNRLFNVARQDVTGLDLTAAYRMEIGTDDHLSARVSATRLTSSQTLLSGLAPVELAGTIFNSPKWRGRAGLTWEGAWGVVAAHANYIGPLEDRRTATIDRLGSSVLFDLAATFRIPTPGSARALMLQVSVDNVFNLKPERIVVFSTSATPFDFTNYPATGRTVNLTVTAEF